MLVAPRNFPARSGFYSGVWTILAEYKLRSQDRRRTFILMLFSLKERKHTLSKYVCMTERPHWHTPFKVLSLPCTHQLHEQTPFHAPTAALNVIKCSHRRVLLFSNRLQNFHILLREFVLVQLSYSFLDHLTHYRTSS